MYKSMVRATTCSWFLLNNMREQAVAGFTGTLAISPSDTDMVAIPLPFI